MEFDNLARITCYRNSVKLQRVLWLLIWVYMSLNLKDRWMTRIMTGGLKSENQRGYKGRMAIAAAGTRVPASICIPLSVQFAFPFHTNCNNFVKHQF
ncbi:hypothetical protein Hanom_Chr10g00893321 [Helianthus anomalus]